MREIDPQSEGRLTEALRHLAASSRQGAPPELGEMLKGEFHRRHARRRVMRRAALAATVLGIALPIALLLAKRPLTGASAGKVSQAVVIPPAALIPPATGVSASVTSQPKSKKSSVSGRTKSPASQRAEFVALPSYDPSARAGDMQIIRLELTGRALRLVGAPVSGEIDERRVLADFVVGQDGTPYAVRLVQ